jgi:hypothetical protein
MVSLLVKIFCEVERLFQVYELPLNELLYLVTDGVTAMLGCKYDVLGKLNAKDGRKTPNFQCITHHELLC